MHKPYPTWIYAANEFWTAGMQDKDALKRHRAVFELIADHAEARASEVDFSHTMLSLEFTGRHHTTRKVTFLLWRLCGKAEINCSVSRSPISTRVTPSEVATAFAWLNEKKPKKTKPKAARKSAGIV